MRDVTLVTPTADQPTGMGLLADYTFAQTARTRSAAWLVVDGGREPICTDDVMGIDADYIRRRPGMTETPVENLCHNLRRALEEVTTEFVIILEHDDCYLPRHIETMMQKLAQPGVLAAGDDQQRYYHVPTRRYLQLDNVGAALCQTGFRSEALPLMLDAIHECHHIGSRGIDAAFWSRIKGHQRSLYRAQQVVGIKGLPGAPGIGVGHRPDVSGYEWLDDSDGEKLREWCGDYASNYDGAAHDDRRHAQGARARDARVLRHVRAMAAQTERSKKGR